MVATLAKRTAFYALVAAIIIMAVFPFYYAVLTSFKSGTALFRVDYWPTEISFDNYAGIVTSSGFLRNLANSLMVATIVVCVSLLLAVTAAYALARVRFRGRALLLLTILSVSMFPQIAVLAGLFELIRAVGIFNTPLALIFSYMIFTLPFNIWVLTTFMRDLPKQIEEAAIMDGCSPLRIVRCIFLPMMGPALISTGLLAFIASWNEFMFALTFILTDENRTVPVAIALISGSSRYEFPYGAIMAASTIVTVPLIILALIFQKHIVSGLTAGAVKG